MECEEPQPYKRDDSVRQEDRHRSRRANVAQNLALTRYALLAIIPLDDECNLPSLGADYQKENRLAINLILKTLPVRYFLKPIALLTEKRWV